MVRKKTPSEIEKPFSQTVSIKTSPLRGGRTDILTLYQTKYFNNDPLSVELINPCCSIVTGSLLVPELQR